MSKYDHLPQGRKRKKVILEPGRGQIADWINRYSLSTFAFTAGIVSDRKLPANPLRTYLLIQNNSAGVMFVNFGTEATAISGIQIIAGGNYIMEGGAPAGAFVAPNDVYILGSAGNLAGVIGQGLWQSLGV